MAFSRLWRQFTSVPPVSKHQNWHLGGFVSAKIKALNRLEQDAGQPSNYVHALALVSGVRASLSSRRDSKNAFADVVAMLKTRAVFSVRIARSDRAARHAPLIGRNIECPLSSISHEFLPANPFSANPLVRLAFPQEERL
jgi:hypothetical protein